MGAADVPPGDTRGAFAERNAARAAVGKVHERLLATGTLIRNHQVTTLAATEQQAVLGNAAAHFIRSFKPKANPQRSRHAGMIAHVAPLRWSAAALGLSAPGRTHLPAALTAHRF